MATVVTTFFTCVVSRIAKPCNSNDRRYTERDLGPQDEIPAETYTIGELTRALEQTSLSTCTPQSNKHEGAILIPGLCSFHEPPARTGARAAAH